MDTTATRFLNEKITPKFDYALKSIKDGLSPICRTILEEDEFLSEINSDLEKTYNTTDQLEEDADTDNYLFRIDQIDKIPNCFVKSVILGAAKQALINVLDELVAMEELEDKKVKMWAENIAKNYDIEVDFANLQVTRSFPRMLMKHLSYVFQVLNESVDKLELFLTEVPENAEGKVAIIRDLIRLRLDSPEMEQLMRDILEITDPGTLRKVLAHPVLQNNDHEKILNYLGTLLKDKLSLDPVAQTHMMAIARAYVT